MLDIINNNLNGFTERNGVLVSEVIKNISYPSADNDICFQIEENSFWFNHRNNCIWEVVKKYYTCDTPFVDVGGGNGFTLSHLEKSGIKPLLIEPGIDGCVNARKRGLKNIICSTLEDAPLKEHSVSAMGFFDVIEHIESDGMFLIQARKFLKENGFIFITVPAYNFLWSKEDKDSGHYRRYTLKSLRNLLTKTGYEIQYETYIFSALVPAVFLGRTLPSIFGLNKNSHDAKKLSGEHKRKSILDSVWNYELNKIKAGKKIPFGSSCLVVAKVTG